MDSPWGEGGCCARADTHGVLGWQEGGLDCYCSDAIAQPEALCSATGGNAGCGSNPCSQPCSACPNTQRCNTTVNGNRTELCGSGGHVRAYRFNCSGAPVPRPWPPPPPPPCHGNGDPGCGALYNPCINQSDPGGFWRLPFCNATLPLFDRVTDAIGRMTLNEKIANLGTGGSSIKGLGTKAYHWWTEASTGVAGGKNENTTKFAFPITLGMSFNRSLWRATGNQIGREARAMMNAGNGYSTFWAPVVNLAREPRWGRNIETAGEDPYHLGQYAEAFVKGMQVGLTRSKGSTLL